MTWASTISMGSTADYPQVVDRVFGHTVLRPGQQTAIEALLSGRDVQVLLATGSGKSLCYQVPALTFRAMGRGPTLVISPLIALMQDQVESLIRRGIHAGALHSAQDELKQREVVAHLLTGKLDLLYVSPERATHPSFRHLLARLGVSLLAIDEAHCISQWGHDFRPEYMRLGELREILKVPTMALTATATPRTMDEICKELGLIEPVVVRGNFDRANLHFSVHPLPGQAERLEHLTRVLREAGMTAPGAGRAIVYCATRKKAETVSEALKQSGFACGHYHAGRTDLARERAVKAYDTGRARVLVATNAFGMGVDYPDIRIIVHFQAPGSLEAYYQEAGRAGRDGLPSQCQLFWGPGDRVVQSFLARASAQTAKRREWLEQAWQALERYAATTTCRQQVMSEYFGAIMANPCGVCDVCTGQVIIGSTAQLRQAPAVEPVVPLSDEQVATVIDAAGHLRRPVGKAKLAKALRGSHDKSLRRLGLWTIPEHGKLAGLSETSLVAAIDSLIRDRRLERRGQKYPTVWLAGRPVRQKREPGNAPLRPRRPIDNDLKKALEGFRRRMARALHWKSYMVFSRAVINQIDAIRPDSVWALEQVRGLGTSRIGRFGQDILKIVREHDQNL